MKDTCGMAGMLTVFWLGVAAVFGAALVVTWAAYPDRRTL